LTNCSQRLANMSSTSQRRLVRLNEYSAVGSDVGDSRPNLQLLLLIPKVRSNRSSFSVSLRVYWIHSRLLLGAHRVQMGYGYACVGNRTGVLDSGRRPDRYSKGLDWVGIRIKLRSIPDGPRDSVTYLISVTCVLGPPRPPVHCLGGRREWDKLGLDSWVGGGWIAPAGKQKRPLVRIRGGRG